MYLENIVGPTLKKVKEMSNKGFNRDRQGPCNKAVAKEILCLWLVAEREILFDCSLLFIENWHLRWSGSTTYFTRPQILTRQLV